MEKQITRWTYWLGMVCFLVAVLWRALNWFRPTVLLTGTEPLTFLKGAVLFLLVAIATANCAWMNSQKS